MSKYDIMKKASDNHAKNPEIGDFWHEMYTPILIVLDVKHNHVIICKEKIYEKNTYIWDFDKIELMTKKEFKKYVSYDSIDGYWCNVHGKQMDVVECYNNG